MSCRLGVVDFAEVDEQVLDSPGDGGVSFDLAGPTALVGVLDELVLDFQPGVEPWRVVRGGDELGAGQVEVTLAGPLGGKAEAATELEFGLEEVALEPVDGLRGQGAGP
ncbi:hypothetical protein ACFOY2_54345 [Nonomuraea purpurea]|uniref:Uncharacterized protein n=1 Tax=Nonomuraea purpurea TaxID=1849276 RepID=A0ABV8GVK1_9ACTN